MNNLRLIDVIDDVSDETVQVNNGDLCSVFAISGIRGADVSVAESDKPQTDWNIKNVYL